MSMHTQIALTIFLISDTLPISKTSSSDLLPISKQSSDVFTPATTAAPSVAELPVNYNPARHASLTMRPTDDKISAEIRARNGSFSGRIPLNTSGKLNISKQHMLHSSRFIAAEDVLRKLSIASFVTGNADVDGEPPKPVEKQGSRGEVVDPHANVISPVLRPISAVRHFEGQ